MRDLGSNAHSDTAQQPWAGCLTSLSLPFLSCETVIIIPSPVAAGRSSNNTRQADTWQLFNKWLLLISYSFFCLKYLFSSNHHLFTKSPEIQELRFVRPSPDLVYFHDVRLRICLALVTCDMSDALTPLSALESSNCALFIINSSVLGCLCDRSMNQTLR